MIQPTFYWIRTWDIEERKVQCYKFTLQEIIHCAQAYHMNMVDVGMVLLNVERSKLGLEPLDTKCIAVNDDHDIYKGA